MRQGQHGQAQENPHAGQRHQGQRQTLPGQRGVVRQFCRQPDAGQDGQTQHSPATEEIDEDANAIEPGEQVVGCRVVGQQPPWRIVLQQQQGIVLDQPPGQGRFHSHKPGAGRPLERCRGDSEDANNERQRLPRSDVFIARVQYFVRGRTRGQLHGATVIAAATAGMAGRSALHVANIDQRRTVHPRRTLCALHPYFFINAKMYRGNFCKQRKHTVGRVQITAPDAFAPAIDKPDRDGGHARSTQHQQRGLRILVDTDQLAIHRGADKGREWPATPAHPARNGTPQAMVTGELRQRAFRTENAAPDASEQHHADHHERPPDAPEEELRKQAQIVVNVGIFRRQRHERRNDQQHQIKEDNDPLDRQNRAAVALHGGADSGQPAGATARVPAGTFCNGPHVMHGGFVFAGNGRSGSGLSSCSRQKVSCARRPNTLIAAAPGTPPGLPMYWKSGESSNCLLMR